MEERSETPGIPLKPCEAPENDLLRLPIEIRLEIYYYCIPRKHVVAVCGYRVRRPRFYIPRRCSTHSYSECSDSASSLSDTDLEDAQEETERRVDSELDEDPEETGQEGDLMLDRDVR